MDVDIGSCHIGQVEPDVCIAKLCQIIAQCVSIRYKPRLRNQKGRISLGNRELDGMTVVLESGRGVQREPKTKRSKMYHKEIILSMLAYEKPAGSKQESQSVD